MYASNANITIGDCWHVYIAAYSAYPRLHLGYWFIRVVIAWIATINYRAFLSCFRASSIRSFHHTWHALQRSSVNNALARAFRLTLTFISLLVYILICTHVHKYMYIHAYRHDHPCTHIRTSRCTSMIFLILFYIIYICIHIYLYLHMH